MSHIYYDHLIDLPKLEKRVKKVARTQVEREELYKLIDDIIHHRVMTKVLDKLDDSHHREFLTIFTERPHDKDILEFLKERIGEDITEFIRAEVNMVARELLALIEEKTRGGKHAKGV